MTTTASTTIAMATRYRYPQRLEALLASEPRQQHEDLEVQPDDSGQQTPRGIPLHDGRRARGDPAVDDCEIDEQVERGHDADDDADRNARRRRVAPERQG